MDEGDLDHIHIECQDCHREERVMANHDNKLDIIDRLRKEFGRHIDDGQPCNNFKIKQVWASGEEAEVY